METMLTDMKIKAEQTERRNAEMHASEERKHNEEIAFLKKTNAQLKVIVIKLIILYITIMEWATFYIHLITILNN